MANINRYIVECKVDFMEVNIDRGGILIDT